MIDHRLGNLADGIYGAELQRRIDEAAAAIRARLTAIPELAAPQLAIVLGSGLGGVLELLDTSPRVRMPYGEIPNVPTGLGGGPCRRARHRHRQRRGDRGALRARAPL